MFDGRHFVFSRKKRKSRIFLFTLYDVEFSQNIEFPITLKDITEFEHLDDMYIDVYAIEGQKTLNILPIRFANYKKEKHINLLYLQDSQDNNVGHFAWIKNLSRLMSSSQLSKHYDQKYICDR